MTCRQHGLFLSAKKCVFFTKAVRWCGRVISKDGIKMDPSRVSALQELDLPQTAGELCQFINCLRWMSNSIPQFAERSAPLVEVLEEAYKKSGRRTKRSIQNMLLQTLSWGDRHVKAFKSLQDTIRSAVSMAFPKANKRICMYTDASDRFWSAVITQTDPEDLLKPIEKQMHEPLAFLGAAFKDAERNWSTFEQEGFAIYQAFKKMDFILYNDKPTHVFTDHRNLLFVFAPLALEPALGRHVVNKVQRWALYLSQFPYVIEHVEGERNVFADILTRWLKGYRSERRGVRRMCKLARISDIVESPAKESFIWPSIACFEKSQQRYRPSPKDDGVTWDQADGLWKKGSCIWIPAKDLELQMKVLVVSHCSLGGHRGQDATESIIRENFVWRDMKGDIAEFVKTCIHCIVTRAGEVIPRPLGTQLHGQRPNEVVHVDYLFMGEGVDDLKYVLLIRDELSSFVWLCATATATGEFAAEMLSKWVAMFSTMVWLITDQGSHFHNALHNDMVRKFKTRKHFTTAYSPWANGTVERVNREVLRAAKALLSEWHLGVKDWPAVVDCVQSVLNQSPLRRLGTSRPGVFRTPLEVFTAIKPSRPLLCALPMSKYKEAESDEDIRVRQVTNIDEVQKALDAMHKDVNERVDAERARQILKHNAKTNVLPANFTVGDFVLVRRAQKCKGHKLQFLWRGPRRITTAINKWVFEVQGLVDKKREVVHARRLLWYRADRDGFEVDPAVVEYATHSETNYEDIHELLEVKEENGEFEVLVEWKGLPDQVDRTYEPLSQLHEDVPDLLVEFLTSPGNREIKRRAMRLLQG